jgi:hypothetical protein
MKFKRIRVPGEEAVDLAAVSGAASPQAWREAVAS